MAEQRAELQGNQGTDDIEAKVQMTFAQLNNSWNFEAKISCLR